MQRNERGFGPLMVFAASKQTVCGREDLQRQLTRALFISAVEMAGALPNSRLDQLERDLAASENRLERATCSPILEAA